MTKDLDLLCYFCDKEGTEQRKVAIDAEPEHDGEDWRMAPVYAEVWLCQEHLEAYENGELYND